MAQSSAADEKRSNNCFTAYVDATAISRKRDILICSHLPSSDELELLVKSSKDRNKVKKLIRTSDWSVNHEIRRSLWVTLCSTIDTFTAASHGYSYHETVQEIFGHGMICCCNIAYLWDGCFCHIGKHTIMALILMHTWHNTLCACMCMVQYGV